LDGGLVGESVRSWLVGWLVGWLAGWLVGVLVGVSVCAGCLVVGGLVIDSGLLVGG